MLNESISAVYQYKETLNFVSLSGIGKETEINDF